MKSGKLLVAIGCVGVMLVGCSGAEEAVKEDEKDQVEEVAQDEKDQVKDEVKKDKEEVKEDRVEEVAPAPKEEPVVDNSAMEKIMTGLFIQQFGEEAVEFDEENKTYKLTPDEGIAMEATLMFIGEADKQPWYDLVESTRVVSDQMLDQMGSGYSIVLVNPMNTDNYLLMIMDGVVLYNFMDEAE